MKENNDLGFRSEVIDYPSIFDILKSSDYTDKTSCFLELLENRFTTLEHCEGTGSSLFLKTFACFLDDSIDSKECFSSLSIGQGDSFLKEVNTYRLVFLDFSDFNAVGYEQAVEYLEEKMSVAYKLFFNSFDSEGNGYYDHRSVEKAIDVMEKKASPDVLQGSLCQLLLKIGGYESRRNGVKVALLIDNLVRLEVVAMEKGYQDEMREFLRHFIVEDVYKFCDVFLQIGDIAEENDTWFCCKRYMAYRYFSVVPFDMQERYREMVVSKDCQHDFGYAPRKLEVKGFEEWVSGARARVREAKIEEEQRRLDSTRRDRLRYAENLSPKVPLFSRNLGIREKRLNRQCSKYMEINCFLGDVYRQSLPDFDADKIYRYILGIKERKKVVEDAEGLVNLLEELPKGNVNWRRDNAVSSWGTWVQATYERASVSSGGSPTLPENLKVYACLDGEDIQEIFVASLKWLLQRANNTFAAKIAVCKRADQMCFWLSRQDFKCLEDFFRMYSEAMLKSMPFVAYKGKLGISKDFPGVDDSHNLTQAHIIADYFKTLKSIDEIDLESMYNNYIAKWNADKLEANDVLGFKGNSALSFIVILDTLDFILNEEEVADGSFLMSGESMAWKVLACSRCWADVNKFWSESIERSLQGKSN